MAQILRGSATTTEAIRRAIQFTVEQLNGQITDAVRRLEQTK
jgi:hypothetical protein